MRKVRTRQRIQTKAGTVIDGRALQLSDWLALIFDPPHDAIIADWQFPTDRHREEYIQSIAKRSEQEIRKLLRRFLIPSGALGTDTRQLTFLKIAPASARLQLLQTEYCRRLILSRAGSEEVQPWEGITWVLDLCSWNPKAAVEALSAYLLAHAQLLPDGRYVGLQDALQIIRARYIGTPSTNSEKLAALMGLSPRQFECVVESTYASMGYTTSLTPPQRDGGRDVLAQASAPGRREQLRIECKRYSRPVPVRFLRSLLGVVSSEKANKGVVVTTSGFTKAARAFVQENPRLEMIDGFALVQLMNEHLGSTWPTRIDGIVIESERRQLRVSSATMDRPAMSGR